MNRVLLTLSVAVSMLACARMEDSGAGPRQSKRAPAAAMASVAAGAEDAPEETVNRRGPGAATQREPSSTSTLSARTLNEKSKALKPIFDAGDGFDNKLNAAMSGTGDALVVGRGAGGMGLRGTGKGGGGEGFGRVGGLGRVDTGGGPPAQDGKIVDEVTVGEVTTGDFEGGLRRAQAFEEQELQVDEEKSTRHRAFKKDADKAEEKDRSRLAKARPLNQPVSTALRGKDLLATELNALGAKATRRPHAKDGEASGLKVGNLRVNSGLYQAGLRSGDVLRSVNGAPVNSGTPALALPQGAAGPVTLQVERDGRSRSIVVTRGARSSIADAGSADRWQIDDAGWSARPEMTTEPTQTLPRMFYFENTYLGRTAAFQERLRRLDTALNNPQAYVHTALDPQRLDAPTDAGLSITTALDRVHPTEPSRVFLQVALQGSHRYGWRRPPLDLAVVLDPHAMAHESEATRRMLDRLLTKLGPQDRLGVVLATDPPRVLVDVQDMRDARDALRALDGSVPTGGARVADAMRLAGARLAAVSDGQARVPGSQTLLVVTNGRAAPAPAARVAHALTVQGAVTSVIDLSNQWGWWSVANAGHGQLYSEIDAVEAVDAELDRASKVVARLLRVNIKLAAGVRAVRVLGSRMLEDAEVKAVKAREVATDLQISKTMGVKADRGDDDDGIQTVIPFFYGGDAHVIMVELWVPAPRRGMPVAEVSLRYKDMVALGNATARSHATLDTLSGPTTPAELMVRRNVRGFELAEALGKASALVARGQTDAARRLLDEAVAVSSHDRRLVDNLRALLSRGVDASVKQAALAYAGQRRISHVAAANP